MKLTRKIIRLVADTLCDPGDNTTERIVAALREDKGYAGLLAANTIPDLINEAAAEERITSLEEMRDELNRMFQQELYDTV